MGVDNGDFLAAMEGLGFDVAEASHSNYTRTALTLASMLNGRHIDMLMPNPPTEVGAQARALSGLINGASLLDRARASGYEIVNIPSAVSWLSVYTADRVLEPPVMNEFELTLGESGLIGRVAPDTRHETFLAQHRMRTLWTFDTLRELPLESAKRPRLIFAHVLVPHPPLAFGPNGEPVVVPGCVWTLCDVPHPLTDEFRSAYGDQLHYLDGLVELTAERIIDDSQRPPIVIFFSDHGSRLVDSFDSMFDNLIVSYTPGRSGLIPIDATPVTLLPRLMNAYLQTDLSLVQDDSYWQPPGAFAPVMGPLAPAAESSR